MEMLKSFELCTKNRIKCEVTTAIKEIKTDFEDDPSSLMMKVKVKIRLYKCI